MTTDNTALRTRFYRVVSVESTVDTTSSHIHFHVLLDGRPVRTPARKPLAVPSLALAEELAAEWRAQATHIDPRTMPLTRLVNSALDGVAGKEAEVRQGILAYAGSDLLCYLAEGPMELVERQSKLWGAIHAWAKQTYGIELALGVGVMPVVQQPVMLARIDAALSETSPIELAALHVMTTLTGSALLALAVRKGRISDEEAWSLAHLDEDYQIEKWGEDTEAVTRRQKRWLEMAAAASTLRTLTR